MDVISPFRIRFEPGALVCSTGERELTRVWNTGLCKFIDSVGIVVSRHQTFTGTSNENDVVASRLLVLWSNGALSRTFMDSAIALVDQNGMRLR